MTNPGSSQFSDAAAASLPPLPQGKKPEVEGFFDPVTATVTYVVADPDKKVCAIVDSVLDYDGKSGRTSHHSADRVADYVLAKGYTVEWLLEAHVHADHLSAAPYLKSRFNAPIAIGENIRTVQKTFRKVFNPEPGFEVDGRQFQHLFKDGEFFRIGDVEAVALHTPGHTPACMTYVIGDAAFVGDTVFMPDFGTARCDFPGGDAHAMYASISKILALPPETRVFVGHDYAPDGRDPMWETTVAEQRRANRHVHEGVSEDEFVRLRTERDATLPMPVLILPSVQVNMRAGEFPPAEDNGVRYLKIPVDLL